MVLHPRRWLIGLVTVPYLAIPLYIVLGERKLRRAGLRFRGVVPAAAIAPVHVTWLDDPVRAHAILLEEIRGARTSIHISTFVLGDDAIGRDLVLALARRVREGLDVRLLVDGLWARRAPRAELAELRRAGGKVLVFLPLLHLPWRGRSNVRNHRKLAVFDGERAIVGGMNLTADYLGAAPGCWRDLSIRVTADAARTLASMFADDWELAGGVRPASAPEPELDALGLDATGHDHRIQAGQVEVIRAGPDCVDDPWHETLLDLVRNAKQRLWIATPYFAPDEELYRAVEAAARRGLDVAIVVPARSNHWVADRVAAPLLRRLEGAGVRVHRYLPTMMHAKAVAVDDSVAAVGTANFDMRSLFLDFEVTVVLHGRDHNTRLAAWFVDTMAGATAAPAPAARGLGRVAELVTSVLAPFV